MERFMRQNMLVCLCVRVCVSERQKEEVEVVCARVWEKEGGSVCVRAITHLTMCGGVVCARVCQRERRQCVRV